MNSSENEEEILVYAELDESVNIESYRSVHVLGIDSINPVIQMDDNFFAGKYEHPLGTYMFFEEDPTAESSDLLFDKLPEKTLKYLCKTRKLLKMAHTYVTPKEGTEQEVLNKLHEPEEEIEIVNFNSVQEAIDKFRREWKPTDDQELNTNTVNLIDQDIK